MSQLTEHKQKKKRERKEKNRLEKHRRELLKVAARKVGKLQHMVAKYNSKQKPFVKTDADMVPAQYNLPDQVEEVTEQHTCDCEHCSEHCEGEEVIVPTQKID